MRWVLMTPFGWPVEPEVNRNFGDRVGRRPWRAPPRPSAIGCVSTRRANAVDRRSRRIGGDHDLDAGRHGRSDGARECDAVGGEHQPRRENVDDGFELAEILRHQRIGHRNRRIRNADMHRREAEQRMLDVVAGQDRDRTLGRQAALAAAPPRSRALPRALAHRSACASRRRVALGEENAIGRGVGPMHQPLGELFADSAGSGCGERSRMAPSPRARPRRRAARADRPQRRGVRSSCFGRRARHVSCAPLWGRAFPETP